VRRILSQKELDESNRLLSARLHDIEWCKGYTAAVYAVKEKVGLDDDVVNELIDDINKIMGDI
jgi:hypothetical protein